MTRAARILEQVRQYLTRRAQEAEASGDEGATQRWGEAAGHVLAAARALGDGDGEGE